MHFTKRRAVLIALIFMTGCAGRKYRPLFRPETPLRHFGTPAPAPPPIEQEPPQRAGEQPPRQEPPPVVAAVPTPEPKASAPRPKSKRKPKPQAVKRPKLRRTPAPVVAAATPEKKENSGGLPPLAYGLMPFGAAALWMGGRAAAHAARKKE